MITLHYHRLYQISSFEANSSLEDMKQLLDRSHLHTGNIPTPKRIIKPDLLTMIKTILSIHSYSLKNL